MNLRRSEQLGLIALVFAVAYRYHKGEWPVSIEVEE